MYEPRPLVTLLSAGTEPLIGPDVLAQYLGFDGDYDAAQDNVLPVLLQAAVEEGEQMTGLVWGATQYRVDGLMLWSPCQAVRLPLSPALAVSRVSRLVDGVDTEIDAAEYTLTPSLIQAGRPWAEVRPVTVWPDEAKALSVICTVGWAADTLPESIRAWLLARVATLYDYRQDVITGSQPAQMPRDHTRALLDRWTVRGWDNA